MTSQEKPDGSDQPRELKIHPATPERIQHFIWKIRRNYSFFHKMTEDEVVRFLRQCDQEAFKEGQRVFGQGEAATHFYMILSGVVSISMRKDGEDTEVARLEAGEILGEMALLEHLPRMASAVAVKESTLFHISVDVFNLKAPTLAYKVLHSVARQLSSRLRSANEHIGIPKSPEPNEVEDQSPDGP